MPTVVVDHRYKGGAQDARVEELEKRVEHLSMKLRRVDEMVNDDDQGPYLMADNLLDCMYDHGFDCNQCGAFYFETCEHRPARDSY